MLTLLNYKDVPTWRRCSGANQNDPSFIQQVWNLATSFDGIPFPGVPLAMAADLFIGRVEKFEITSPLFCSGLAALMFKKLGIIDPTEPCKRLLLEGLLLEVPRILERHQRIVRRRPADRASHDALSEITTLEAIRAKPFSAREFDLLSVSFAPTLPPV